MSSIEGIGDFDMSIRQGESVTDVPDWDNEIIEWDSSTGIYTVAGIPVSMCQGVAMFKEDEDERKQD
jgi:hypothetical protein